MKTLLVLASHPELADAIRTALNPEKYRLVHRINVEQAEPLLSSGRVHACLIDIGSTNVQGLWAVEKIKRLLPLAPIVAYAPSNDWPWEEEAYLQGVSYVLSKPVRPRLLNLLLDRLWSRASSPPPTQRVPAASPPTTIAPPTPIEPPSRSAAEALGVLRSFSSVLSHSLCAEALLKQFLLSLREILGVNRAAIFLKPPASTAAGSANPSLPEPDPADMRSACAIGLAPDLLEHFALSFENGIGGHLFREGRIIRRESPEAVANSEIQQEFELLGAQVAIPILDRETLVGVATFDGRVTGEALVNGELELIFHLLEELGMAVRNIWLHDRLAENNEMMGDVLRELSCACVVVSKDLIILHANKAARSLFSRPGQRSAQLDFSDLPEPIGSKVYQVISTGAGVASFRHQPPTAPQHVHHITIVPFIRNASTSPHAVLLVVEDHTQAEALRKLEIETASLRLLRTMADRLAHEVGNALVPLSTHQQLLAEKFKDPEFRASLDVAMSDSVKRVSRLISQMRYLAREAVVTRESVSLSQLVKEAFKEAHTYQPAKSAKLQYDNGKHPIVLVGDRAALTHALAEVILNAIQANPADAKVAVHAQTKNDPEGHEWVQIEITDNGVGFTSEAAERVPAPFFTTRTVGLGLGLCVSRKIIEVHHGQLVIPNPDSTDHGAVRISLPVEAPPSSTI